MSKSVSLTGADTIKINNRIFSDLADGDCAVLTYPNELATVKTGKDGNSIYAFNQTGQNCDLVLRVLRGSSDDKFLLNLLNNMKKDFSRFILMTGEFIKRVGDGTGSVSNDTYLTTGGIFNKNVDAKNNVEGDTEQSVSIYTLRFSNGDRSIM
jgi:hypothetical protein